MANVKDIIVSIVCQNLHHNARLCNHYKMGCYDVVGAQKLMPKEDQSTIEYTSKVYEEYAPFVLESDFECFNIQHTTTARHTTKSYIDVTSTHEPNAYAIHISISNQFENKIDGVDLKSYYLFSVIIRLKIL